MTLSPAFIGWEQRTRQEGLDEGLQRVRITLQELLTSRFGQVDSQLEAVIDHFAKLDSENYTRQLPLLLNLSRAELVARFGMHNDTNGNGTQE
ncbi:MAG: hypothetical protein AAFY11_07575 [Cyanobacteria bacterium J06641_5]